MVHLARLASIVGFLGLFSNVQASSIMVRPAEYSNATTVQGEDRYHFDEIPDSDTSFVSATGKATFGYFGLLKFEHQNSC